MGLVLKSSSMTPGSASVEVSPTSRSPSATLRSSRRMILPERVLGRPTACCTTSGVANAPILRRTSFFSESTKESVNAAPSARVTKQYRDSPLTACGRETTAASATWGCSVSTLSTSEVDIKCPETFSMSSMRPVTHRNPSSSRLAPIYI